MVRSQINHRRTRYPAGRVILNPVDNDLPGGKGNQRQVQTHRKKWYAGRTINRDLFSTSSDADQGVGSLFLKKIVRRVIPNSQKDARPPQLRPSDASLDWHALYPFQPKRFQLDGVEMSFVDEGTGDPVLMVHGNPTWSFYWRGLIKRLSGQHRTIAVDHIGCGLSDKPANYPYRLAQHRDNLVKLVDALELNNITLMVHDWGGAIGLATLLERQDKFKRIVLFNTGAFPPPYIPLRIRACRWPIVGKIGVQGFNMFARAAVKMATEQPGGLPKPVANGMLAPYDSWSNRSAIYGFVKDIPATPSHETWAVLQDIETRLPGLNNLPILMIWGMKDWCFRTECLDRFCKHWPHAEVHRIASAGHLVVEDAATQVETTTADFLSRS